MTKKKFKEKKNDSKKLNLRCITRIEVYIVTKSVTCTKGKV